MNILEIGNRKWEGFLRKKKTQTEYRNFDHKLRDEAEEKLAWSPGATAEMQEKTPEEVIHELQVHQIELEMQNEELRRSQLALEESRQRFADLYDFAPVGYFTFTREALIKEVNLTGTTLLGVARQKLIKSRFRRFVELADFDRWDQHFLSVLRGGEKQTCDLTLKRQDGSPFSAGLESIRIEVSGETPEVHTAVTDTTERKKAEEKLDQTLENFRKALGGIIQVISATVETRDPYTAGHQRRTSDLARAIGGEMDLTEDQKNGLFIAGTIHDLGKISIPAEILSKPTKLSEIEYKLVQTHSQTGHDILKEIDFPWPLAEIVLQHHERLNGSGYPRGLKGEDISPEAQILMVADVVEAMASYRPYRPALGVDAALEEIEKNKGILYNPKVVGICERLFREMGFGFE